jgi:hypothetical protein
VFEKQAYGIWGSPARLATVGARVEGVEVTLDAGLPIVVFPAIVGTRVEGVEVTLDAGLPIVVFPAIVGTRVEGVEVTLDAGLPIVVFSEETAPSASVIIVTFLLPSPRLDTELPDGRLCVGVVSPTSPGTHTLPWFT